MNRAVQSLPNAVTYLCLLSTGLDLVEYPTLLWFEVDYLLSTRSQ